MNKDSLELTNNQENDGIKSNHEKVELELDTENDKSKDDQDKKDEKPEEENDSTLHNILAGIKSDLDEIPDNVDQDFANTTSLHGVQHFVKKKSVIYKFGWILIFITCVFICLWQIIDRLKYYFSYPASRDIEVKEATMLLFPAITMCTVYRYNNNTISDVDREFMKISKNYFEALNRNRSNYTEWDLPLLTNILTELYEPHEKFNFSEVMFKNSFQIDDRTLKYCRFGGRSCSAQDFILSFNYKYQLCWTFNGHSQTPLSQTSPGSDYGFKFSVDLKEKDYITLIPSPRIGWKIFFHPPYEHPYIYGSGYAFGPGLQTRATVSYQLNKNLPSPHGHCNKKQTPLMGFRNYSLSNCLLECGNRALIESCQCRPLFYPGGGISQRSCDFKDLDCINNHSDPSFGIYSDVEKKCKDMCKVGCEEEYFSVVLSYVQLVDNKNFESVVELMQEAPAEYIRKNYLFLNVYYDEFLHTVTEQKISISFSALISDIGGQMGLFLGISILTIIEIFEYCGRRAISEVNVRMIKKRPESKDGRYSFIGKRLIKPINTGAKAQVIPLRKPYVPGIRFL